MAFSVRCTIMQTPERGELQVLRNVIVRIDDGGLITSITPAAAAAAADGAADIVLPPTTVVLPGLVDTHIHAPQWPSLGTGLDLPLEVWLATRTYPAERRLTDPAAAAAVWPALVATLLAHGTTTAVYYATIDVTTTTMLAAAAAEAGQRAFVGRVAMDDPAGTPPDYRDADAAAGVAASAASAAAIRSLGSPLVAPILTPRFGPACTPELLAGLGRLAAATGTRVQTHCSESDWQHGDAGRRWGVSDAAALDRHGLLCPHTVLAHGVHLSEADMALVASRGAGVAHCPLSNAYFANAVFPARRALAAGVRVGLGSDVAGGPEVGMLGQVAAAVTASRYLEEGVDAAVPAGRRGVPSSRLTIADAFWMATVGGGALLGTPAGLLAAGRPWDAVAVATGGGGGGVPLRVWGGVDDDAAVFEKVVRLARATEMEHVWVGGRRVAGAAAA